MEVALLQAKKSCPFIHVASASSLRRLTTGSNTNRLLLKAKQCPIMSQAIQSRSISTTKVAPQTPSKPLKASVVGKFSLFFVCRAEKKTNLSHLQVTTRVPFPPLPLLSLIKLKSILITRAFTKMN